MKLKKLNKLKFKNGMMFYYKSKVKKIQKSSNKN